MLEPIKIDNTIPVSGMHIFQLLSASSSYLYKFRFKGEIFFIKSPTLGGGLTTVKPQVLGTASSHRIVYLSIYFTARTEPQTG